MTLYKNKYRSESARATWWNYGWAGAYFITICTKDRKHYFGKINSGEQNTMQFSNCGLLADIFWHEIKNHAKNVELGAFVVMPNHVHCILILTANSETAKIESVVIESSDNPTEQLTFAQQRFQNQGKNTISSIIGSYKSAVTKHANRLGIEFGWHQRFHDHIIRNDAEYQRINDYIESNVQKWKNDKFFD